MMTIDKKLALKMWKDIFGDKLFVEDCYGTVIYRDGYSNEPYILLGKDGKRYDYSWNLDHIRPKSCYKNENDADDLNNLEPISRQNNLEKSDSFPCFSIRGIHYKVVVDPYGGYGIETSGRRVDWKGVQKRHYKK